MQHVKSRKVQIAPIHDVDRASFQYQHIEYIHIAQFAVGDVDEAYDVAAQIEQRVHLHCRLGATKQRPRKERQAQVDSRRIQRVGCVLQIDAKTVADVELPGLDDQVLGELFMDAPVPRLVGIGQCGALDLLPESPVVKLGRLRREADLDVTQALAIGQLREGHHAKLIGSGERLHVAIAIAVIDNSVECFPWQEVHKLSEQRFAKIHRSLRWNKNRKTARSTTCRSSRGHALSLWKCRQ